MGGHVRQGFLQLASSVGLLALMVASCSAADEHASFDTHTNCDTKYTVDHDSRVFVTEDRDGNSQSSSINNCLLQFQAAKRGERLCVEMNKLKFKNQNLRLSFYDSLDPTDNTPTKSFSLDSSPKIPQEFCSIGRDASLQLEVVNQPGNIRDVDLDIVIHNMHGNTRKGDMVSDCSTTYNIDNSTIQVSNRLAGGSVNLTSPCQLYFEYTGVNQNNTLCLQFKRNVNNCGYKLKVFDGSPADFVPEQEYSCTNDKPRDWCADKKGLYLELIRDDVTTSEPTDMFTLQIKDGIKGKPSGPISPSSTANNGEVTFPTDPEPSPSFPMWAIGVIVGGAVLIIIVAVVIVFVKKSKGYSSPTNQHEVEKL